MIVPQGINKLSKYTISMIEKTKAPTGTDAIKTIITNDVESNKDEELLTTKVSDPMLRSGAFVAVVRYYAKRDKTGLDLLQKVNDWNKEYLEPPFSEEDIKVYLQFFLQGKFSENQNKVDEKENRCMQVYKGLKSELDFRLFRDQNNVPYAQVKVGNKLINFEVQGPDFSNYVRRLFHTKTGKNASEPVLKEVVGLLVMEALYESEQHNLNIRVSSKDEAQYYDLQNPAGDVVKVTAKGWNIVSIDSVPFTFSQGLSLEQVMPERGGSFKDFLQFLNLSSEDEKILFLCTLPVRYIRDVEQAIAYVYGPAGSGKTTLLKMTKDLVDPSIGGISIPVRKPEHVMPLLNKTWVFANDNISKLSDEMSDFLCTLATGGESSRRKLYTDGGVHTFTVKNPAYLTGINVEASNSDLLSRTMLFKTDAVVDGERLSGKELQDKFEEMKPRLLGSIFDVLSEAMRIKPTLKCKTNFRMNDFAMWGAACAEALDIGADRFLLALDRAMEYRAYDAIHSSNAGRILLDYLKENSSFEGTSTELLNALKKFRDGSSQYDYDKIANSPNGLGKKLRQLENSLLEVGIRIDFDNRTADKRVIKIHLTPKSSIVSDSTDTF